MRKKIWIILFSIMLGIFIMGGCSKESDTSDDQEEMTFDDITWPTSEIAKKVPQPESVKGHTEWENENGFVIYITDINSDQFKQYVDACKSAGFTNDYQSGDDYYYADLSDGTHLNLQYENEYDNTMFIRADAPANDSEETNSDASVPEESSEETAQEPEAESQPATNTDQTQEDSATDETTESTDLNVNSDFKATMDSYESFMNDYVDFMKKYENASDDEYLSMLQEYTEMMIKYNDMAEKMDSIDTDTLSSEELAYYTLVMGRVTEKLAELN